MGCFEFNLTWRALDMNWNTMRSDVQHCANDPHEQYCDREIILMAYRESLVSEAWHIETSICVCVK